MNAARHPNHGYPGPGQPVRRSLGEGGAVIAAARRKAPLILTVLFAITSCKESTESSEEISENPAPQAKANPTDSQSKQPNDWSITRGGPALEGRVEASIPKNPSIDWTFDLDAPAMAEAAVADGLVVVGDIMGIIHGIDLETRDFVWTHETEDTIQAAPAISKGRVFVGSGDNTFLALDLKSGDEIWSVDGDEKFPSAPIVTTSPDGSEEWVLVNGYDGVLRCLRTADGSPVWTFGIESYINGTPAIVDGKSVAFGGCDKFIYTLDLEKGVIENEVATDAEIISSVATSGNTIFCSTYVNQLVAATTEGDELKWIYEAEDFPFSSSPAVAPDHGLVYIGSKDRHLHAVRTDSGEGAWTFRTGGPVESSPLVFTDGVIFGSNDGRLYAVSHQGEELWKLDLGEKLTAPPVFAADRIIITGAKGTVFVIR
ncbi:MAG: PQQ-binding-like beta-propeller repeat protein [Verrucomicrobiota bacterium]